VDTVALVAPLATVVASVPAVPLKLALPAYAAESVTGPGVSGVHATLAVPAASSVTGAPMAAPSPNCTVPCGKPLPGATADTVAVSVTCWPYTGEVGAISVAVVSAFTTLTPALAELPRWVPVAW
jgi:hypothetical protein